MASKPKKRKINGENPVETEEIQSFLSYFFYKKIPLSRRVGYAMDGSMDEWVSERCMYVTPVRLDLL